jgi:1,2-dihydroxy-3-keto-5-methylthiopentene dioxygenase
MAVVVDTLSGVRVTSVEDVRTVLDEIGVEYERWIPKRSVGVDASADDLLDAFAAEIEVLKAREGYATADVIAVTPATPGLDAMLAKFASEHTHDDDEVRFVVAGRGIFFVRAEDDRVVSIEVGEGDLIRLPAGIKHWFTLCNEKTIRAIRLFKDQSGWVPRYTESGADVGVVPVCLGPAFVDHVGGPEL